MKNYYLWMIITIFTSISILHIFSNKPTTIENIVFNNILYSTSEYNTYEEETVCVYEDMTLEELTNKLNVNLKSDLEGYGDIIADFSLKKGVDPLVATSIILEETGCTWNCSSLVKNNNNVGGMRAYSGYLKFDTLEEGIEAFISNLSNNYYQKGLNTPELINTKYASNPNWYQKINYYITKIRAS